MAKYIWPVPAWTGINQLFGTYPGGFNPIGGHTGTDYGTPIGTPIRAIADGVVKHAGWFRGSYYDNPWLVEPSFAGIVVVIDHGECLSLYAHMNDTPLNVGERVKQGDVIGGSGNTRDGVSVFGPHLHFEIMPDGWNNTNGTYGRVNPALYCTQYWGTADQTSIQPESSGTTTPLEEMDIDMATPQQVVEALLEHKITIDGQEARFQDWFVAIVKDSGKALKRDEILTAGDKKTKARVGEIIANLGADMRAVKNVTDRTAK